MSYYLTDFSHILISGATGAGSEFGGKTVLGNWFHRQSVASGFVDMSVFVNTKGHDFIRGVRVSSLDELSTAFNYGYKLIDWVPNGNIKDSHQTLINTLRKIPGTKTVIHDEAHGLHEDSLDWCFRQGGNVGTKYKTDNIRSIGITQHPWDLNQSLLNNTPLTIWVGPKTLQSKRYFQAMQLGPTYEKIPDDLDPFHWVVIDGGELQTINKPVPEAYAKNTLTNNSMQYKNE